MRDVEIVDTIPEHLRYMAEAMKQETKDFAFRMGITPNKALWRSWKQSIICKTVFFNGKIAAIWGVGGLCFSDTGFPWIVMTPETAEHPFKVVFAFRDEIKRMQLIFPQLEDYVPTDNITAVRLLKLIGFEVNSEPVERHGVAFYKAVRRT